MGMELQQQANPTSFIEYNGYLFGTKTKSRLQIIPQSDTSRRTEIKRRYILLISTIIVPRRNIPGDNTALNIQLPAPAPGIPVPGIPPSHLASTVDSEVKLIIERLTEQGKTLRYIGQGTGDLVVNTIHPKTGQFIQDLDFGPHCKITKLEPIGFNKCFRLEWECEFSLQPGKVESEGLNDLHKRILEYNFGVDYRYDQHGYCIRTVQGHIRIVPPMFRGLGSLPPTGTSRNVVNADDFNTLSALDADAARFLQFGGVEGNVIQDIFYNLTSAIKKYREDCLLMPYEAALSPEFIRNSISNVVNLLGPIFNVDDRDKIALRFDAILVAFENAYTAGGAGLAENVYKRNIVEADKNIDAFFYFRNYFITGLIKKVPELRQYPEIADMFPTGSAPLDNRICYGPFLFDNIGNLQNYETVDQYKELIYNSVVIPFGYRRQHSWSIDQNKAVMRFSFTDTEQPAFSYVPGYSAVQAHQDTTSTGTKFIQFNTNITATFKMGKFIAYNPDFPPTTGYSDYYRNGGEIGPILNHRKFLPSKKQAYADFLKLVFQRLSVPILLHNKGINIETEGPDKKRLSIKSGMSCIPHTFQCREDILSDTITYTLGYKLTSEINSFFILTGHGLPAIIASDLNVTEETAKFIAKKPDEIGGRAEDADIEERRKYVASILFSKYTDVCTHRDWLLSQRFASNNARGGSDLYFDRSFDRPININILGENLTRTIPLHGEYPNLKPKRDLTEFKFTSYPVVVGLFGSNVIKCTVIKVGPTGVTKELAGYVYQDGEKPSFEVWNNVAAALGGVRPRLVSMTKEAFTKHKENEEKRLKDPFIVGYFMKYEIFGAAEFLEKNPEIKPHGLPLTNDDIDIFYEDLANDLPVAQQPAYKSQLNVPTVDFSENDPAQNITEGNVYNSVDDFVSENVGDFITRPSAVNSWLEYECDIKIETDNKIIRHKRLPSVAVTSDFGALEIPDTLILNELIQTNHDAIFNTGPNSLKGGSPASDLDTNIPTPINTDVIQTLNEPSHVVILSGWAARVHYEVVAPTLLRYGGCPVIQKKRVFSKRTSGERENQTHYGAWYIEYYVDGHPSGFLGTPSTPWQVDDEVVEPSDENISDTVILEEQTDLLDQASSLIGFVTQ